MAAGHKDRAPRARIAASAAIVNLRRVVASNGVFGFRWNRRVTLHQRTAGRADDEVVRRELIHHDGLPQLAYNAAGIDVVYVKLALNRTYAPYLILELVDLAIQHGNEVDFARQLAGIDRHRPSVSSSGGRVTLGLWRNIGR